MSHRVLVTGLMPDTTHDALRDFFSRTGNVEAVEQTANGTEAYITFSDRDSVDMTIGTLNGVEFRDGVPVTVAAAPPLSLPITNELNQNATALAGDSKNSERYALREYYRSSREERLREGRYSTNGRSIPQASLPAYHTGGSIKDLRDMYKVCVTKLSPQTMEDDLRVFFSKSISDQGYINDLYLDHRRNYAFVGFSTAEAMEAALKESGTWLKGQLITIERKRILNRANRVVILGLPSDCTEGAVRIFFSGCGEMSDLHLDPTRGMAFANFTEPSAVMAAVAKTGEEMGGSVLTIQHREFKTCFHCNQDGHVASHCPTKGNGTVPVCHKCGKGGHKARSCDSRPPMGPYGEEKKRRRLDNETHNRYRLREDRGELDFRDHHHRRRHLRSRSRSRSRSHSRDRSYRRRHQQRRSSQSRSRSRSRSPHSHRHQRRSNRSRSPVRSSHRH
ncbi:unnamed protein product [Phytomonas sp. Hart1]|nr:unnamed protein product [Phytomonas sp. Hart1]|eukprot:CCW70475.1 unnamed protein product [Phytomonas sp. isolate Hart1]